MKYNDKLITELGAFFVDHGRYYGVDPVWHDHSKLVASDGAPDPALSADASGYLTAAVHPLFSAYNSATDADVTGDGTVFTIICDTEVFDRNSNYNNATGVFTAPVTGKYLFVYCVYCLQIVPGSHLNWDHRLVTSNRSYYGSFFVSPPGTSVIVTSTAIADMDAADTAYCRISLSNHTKTVDVYGGASMYTYFQGYLLM